MANTGGAAPERLLVLIRHAEAEAGGGDDHARRLTPSGRRAASEAGRWLGGQVRGADLAWVSSAVRAQQTWAALVGPVSAAEVRVERALYQASAREVVEGVEAAQVATTVVVGHNPTMEQVLVALAGDRRGMRPGAVALVDLGRGRLVESWEPSR